VFVVGCLGDWRSAAAVLFESHSLSGNPAPSREKGQKVAPAVSTGAPFSRTGNERVECDAIIPVSDPAYCLETTCNDYSRADGFNMIAQPIPIHDQATRHAGKHGDKQDGKGNGLGIGQPGDPMNTLTKGDRHAVAQPIPLNSMNCFRSPDAAASTGCGIGEPGEAMFTITKTNHHAVAHPTVLMDQGGSVMNVLQDGTVGTLRRETHGHEPVVMQPTFALDEYNQSGHKEVCYPLRTAMGDGIPKVNVSQPVTAAFKGGQGSGAGGIGYSEHVAPTLPASDGGNRTPTLLQHMAVRRLTPTECERLQGFPDGYTNIPWRKQPESPDGPRYKSLGNSMAVPVMKWIGRRIADAP